MEELRKQTVNLFSFQPLPKAVYDTQVAFNMLAQLGEDASQSLESIELRIERHLASLLGARAAGPMPSIRLVQAPVFHGYSLSIHVEFEGRPGVLDLASALNSSQVDVRVGDVEAPHNVGITGQSGISVGSILPDRNDPNGCWFWLVTDNFRLMAENAVGVIRFLLASETANRAK
jgi:aspartate-semialdehyde dehydrogenase